MTEPSRHLEELRRVRRVADQMASMHSVVRDGLQRQSSFVLVLSLVLSLALLLLALVEPEFVRRSLGFAPDAFRWVLAAGAFLNFLLIAVDLAFRPAARAQAHEQAVKHFAKGKNHFRDLERQGDSLTDDQLQDAKAHCFETADLPRIPERRFLRLKQWHLRKVAISRALDSQPLEPLRRLKRKLRDSPPDRPGV